MAGAFQSDAFQNDAFQTEAAAPPQTDVPAAGRRKRRRSRWMPPTGVVWTPEEVRKTLYPQQTPPPAPVVGAGMSLLPRFTGMAHGEHGVAGSAVALLPRLTGTASGEFFDSVSADNALLLLAA